MGGGGGGANLPVMSVSLNDGNALKAAMMSGPVTVTMNRGATVDRDGTLDNTVVAHEWGHYIHLRQVFGGSAALSAESEGWGDFFALHTLVRQGDNLDGAFAMAQYVTVSFPDDPNYFGIRRYPYSVDFTKNALTFKHITDGEALPAGVPVAQSTAQVNNAEPHAAGEIWASMLFEAYIALLKKSQAPGAPYDFTAARRRMSDYVEGGLKLAPLDPTYTEQRDAILAAAAAADLDDLQVLAAAFARRGAGTCAVSPARDSTDFSGVVESFTVQPNLSITSVTIDDSVKSCDNDGQLDAEETGKVTVMVLNTGTAPVTNATATVVSTAPGISFPSGVTLSFGTLPPFGAATATVDIAMAGTITKMENVDLQVTLDGAASCAAQSFTTSPLANFDEVPGSSNVDHVETVSTAWKLDGDGADTIWTRTEQPGGNHVWTGIDYSSPSDTSLVSPPVTVAASGNFVLTFDHRYSFEQSMGVNWDGSLIEISGDGGGTWEDISTYGAPGYTGTIGDPQGQAQNALINRDGYVGESAAYPAMETVTIDLGTAFANKTVQVRFRIGTDDAAGANGWDVDNIQFDGITAQPFGSLIDDKASCGMPPFANAGPDQVVLSGQFVGLDGTQSKDPQNLPLTFAWQELSGAPVTLTGADTAKPTFNAPAVAASTTLTFQLTVSDGSLSATDTIDVIVTPDGGGPDAGPGPDGGVADGGADAGADGGDSGEAIAFGGCGCETKSGPGNAGAAFSLLGLAALFTRRRRSAKA
jgi:MYXO-CTERM domain-containing protein